MQKNKSILKRSYIDSPIGLMIAIADDHVLHLLEFADYYGLERQITRLAQEKKSAVVAGQASPLESIAYELEHYFKGQLKEFTTPLVLSGTDFQNNVWKTLIMIPYGKTQSYVDIARKIGKPTAFRAVAQANGANRFVVVIPCHRIINANGELGGYSSGLSRKKWLLDFENQNMSESIG